MGKSRGRFDGQGDAAFEARATGRAGEALGDGEVTLLLQPVEEGEAHRSNGLTEGIECDAAIGSDVLQDLAILWVDRKERRDIHRRDHRDCLLSVSRGQAAGEAVPERCEVLSTHPAGQLDVGLVEDRFQIGKGSDGPDGVEVGRTGFRDYDTLKDPGAKGDEDRLAHGYIEIDRNGIGERLASRLAGIHHDFNEPCSR